MIFNNKKFVGNQLFAERHGTEKDVQVLENVFGALLGFRVSVYNDKSEVEMMLLLQECAEQNHAPFSAFFVIILSHGEKGVILTSDCKAVKVCTIASRFTVKNCPSLARKPKIFIVQACQGSDISEVMRLTPCQQQQQRHPVDRVEQDGEVELIAQGMTLNDADFLFAFSTMSGKASMRDTERGSWYIQELARALELYANEKSFIAILTQVARNVASNEHEDKAQLCT